MQRSLHFLVHAGTQPWRGCSFGPSPPSQSGSICPRFATLSSTLIFSLLHLHAFFSLSLVTAQSSHSSCLCSALTSGENHLLLLSMMCCLCAANFLINAEIQPMAGSSAQLLQDADTSINLIFMQTPWNWVLFTVKFTAAFILLSSHESTWRRTSTFSDSQNETGSPHPRARWE